MGEDHFAWLKILGSRSRIREFLAGRFERIFSVVQRSDTCSFAHIASNFTNVVS